MAKFPIMKQDTLVRSYRDVNYVEYPDSLTLPYYVDMWLDITNLRFFINLPSGNKWLEPNTIKATVRRRNSEHKIEVTHG